MFGHVLAPKASLKLSEIRAENIKNKVNNSLMVQGVNDSDLLASYEHDFKDCVTLLNDIINDVDPASKL